MVKRRSRAPPGEKVEDRAEKKLSQDRTRGCTSSYLASNARMPFDPRRSILPRHTRLNSLEPKIWAEIGRAFLLRLPLFWVFTL